MFYILPKLQAKRGDFLTVMLTGSLHQRRGFMATPPDTQDDEPREDDVTKSESDSLDQSQDGPPSTLLAIDPQKGPRDPGSVADVDLDQEDISKTLVLFSPGDMKKSLNSGAGTDVLQSEKEAVDFQTCLLEKNQQPSTKYGDAGNGGIISSSQQNTATPTSPPVTSTQKHQPAHEPLETQAEENDDRTPVLGVKKESNQPASSTCPSLTKSHQEKEPCKNQHGDPDDIGIFSVVRQKNNPSTTVLVSSGSPASPPFTKVERTFIHIAETTHLNIMSSRLPQVQRGDHELPENLQCEVEPQTKNAILAEAGGGWPKTSSHNPAEIVRGHCVVNGPVQSQAAAMVVLPEMPKDVFLCRAEGGKGKSTRSSHLTSRSRIPVLVSEDSADPSLSRDQTRKRSKRQEFARLVLDRQRQMLNSRTSSSLSSGDEPRRASETMSTTEEDTHQSDDSIGKVKKEVRERGCEGWSSRIPRPLTPVKRAPTKLLFTIAAKPTVRTETTTHTGSRCVQSGGSVRSKSALCRPASPRTPLRCIFTTSRSLNSTHRTLSPSPHRMTGRTLTRSKTRSTAHTTTHNTTHIPYNTAHTTTRNSVHATTQNTPDSVAHYVAHTITRDDAHNTVRTTTHNVPHNAAYSVLQIAHNTAHVTHNDTQDVTNNVARDAAHSYAHDSTHNVTHMSHNTTHTTTLNLIHNGAHSTSHNTSHNHNRSQASSSVKHIDTKVKQKHNTTTAR